MRYRRRSVRDDDDDLDDEIGQNLVAVNDRLDALTRQIERIAQGNSSGRDSKRPDERPSDHVTEALDRLDRRLEQIIVDGRQGAGTGTADPGRRNRLAPPPPLPPPPSAAPPQPTRGPANWAAEIMVRRRLLDGETPAAQRPPIAAPAPPLPPSQDLTGLEQQLRAITGQIASLHQPFEKAFATLRSDLAEVSHALTEAMPRRAIEALEAEVRRLADRIDRSRGTGVDAASLAGLEQGLAEVRDTLHRLAPAENLVGCEEAVHELSRKIDQIGSVQADPLSLHQFEQAVAQMRDMVSNVASDGALTQLAAEVHSLSSRFERLAAEGSSEALYQLEHRIASLMDSGRTVPSGLETAIQTLSERLDRMQLSQGDQLALGSLEDRIVKLAEKLDASDARLRNLDNIERGIGDLLILLDEMRHAPPGNAHVAAAEPPPPPPPPPAPQPPAVVRAPAPPNQPIPPAPPIAAAAVPASAETPHELGSPAKAAQRPEPRRPIDPDLPPDMPLEPGAGMPRVKPGSPAARIAASEAALAGAMPAATSLGKSAAIAAARNAARSAYSAATPQAEPKPKPEPKHSWLKFWERFSAKKSAAPISDPAPRPALVVPNEPVRVPPANTLSPIRQRVFGHVKTVLIAASVVIIVLGGLQVALDFFMPASSPETPTAAKPDISRAPAPSAPSTAPVSPMPAPAPDTTGSIMPWLLEPNSILNAKPPAPDITGSIPQRLPAPAPQAARTVEQAIAALPASIGPALRTAAAGGNPAAAYEISMRYVDGRGVPLSGADALFWLERAAAAGFAPAQFRLGSLNEKGDGVKKDLGNARRLYLAAAHQGHAKAMHNLAVLYAEGIDGKPDYKVAAEWFRKAANHGVADSQYNLAILYARGIGVEQNLAESYRWFALAAAKGDQDAAKKRDEVAKRLDQQSLVAAKLAVQTFTPEPEPDAAVNLRVPPGGWDQATAVAHPPKSKPHTPGPAGR